MKCVRAGILSVSLLFSFSGWTITAEKCEEFKSVVCTAEYDPHHCDANRKDGTFIAGFFGTNQCRAIAQANYDLCLSHDLYPEDYDIVCFEE